MIIGAVSHLVIIFNYMNFMAMQNVTCNQNNLSATFSSTIHHDSGTEAATSHSASLVQCRSVPLG